MAEVRAISGLGAKGPACFVLDTGRARILFDLGEGPQPGLLPDIGSIGRVDALLLSHQHGDHAGALRFLPDIGNPPVFASAIVGRTLPSACKSTALPLQGTREICGLTITTGRSGHAPGGLWFHVATGDGFLYMGDHCVESPLYAFDPPPPAGTAILDASYGDYEKLYTEAESALEGIVAANERVLLPVPAQGRGPEIALQLFRYGHVPALDDEILGALKALVAANAECVKPDAIDGLKALISAAKPIASDFRGVSLCSPATAKGPVAERAISALESGLDIHIVFTGYVPPGTPADRLMKAKKARVQRWNIHPRLSDNAQLAGKVGARTVLPAFGDRKALPAWGKAFAPRRVVIEGAVTV
jgi:Cft2 family RNA processing exonuclease